jgi:hypothetical protein
MFKAVPHAFVYTEISTGPVGALGTGPRIATRAS